MTPTREAKIDDPELASKKLHLNKIHSEITSKRIKIESLRKKIDITPIDPRYNDISDKLRSLSAEIESSNDELKILNRQQKVQNETLKRLKYE